LPAIIFDLFQMLKKDGTKGHWDKGTFVFLIFHLGQKLPIKIIIYIINIYINNIYNNSQRPFADLPHSYQTMQNPFVPMSLCPIVPCFFALNSINNVIFLVKLL